MATYVVFQALSYKSYPFGITSSFGSIATLFKYPFSALAENPVIQKYSNSPAAVISMAMLFSVALGGFAAAGIHPWVIVPVAAILFISIIYLANKKVDDFRKNF